MKQGPQQRRDGWNLDVVLSFPLGRKTPTRTTEAAHGCGAVSPEGESDTAGCGQMLAALEGDGWILMG